MLQSTKREQGSPVDVYEIAELHHITVKEKEFPSSEISGFLKMNDGGKAVIVVNKEHSKVRRRFTIAHELGHYALHARETLHVDDFVTAQSAFFRDAESAKATKIKEIEANQFAAELLMPSREIQVMVREKIKSNMSVDEVIDELAKQYQVSTVAMAIKTEATAF